MTILFRILSKYLDFVFLAEMVNRTAHLNKDFALQDKRPIRTQKVD